MIPYPNLDSFPALEWAGFDWLRRQGVSLDTLIALTPIRTAKGRRASDGRFDLDPKGMAFLVFPEAEDVVFWQPRTGELSTWNGRAWALGQDVAEHPGTYSFDCALNLFGDPLEWLRANCDGCVILDWSRVWSRLHDVPRVAVDEPIWLTFKQHMRPPGGPETFILARRRAVA
jgi:hypothetical protein